MFDAVPVGLPSGSAVRDGGVALFTRRIADLDAVERGLRRTRWRSSTPTPRMLADLTEQVATVAANPRRADARPGRGRGAPAAERGGLRGKLVLTTG